MTTTTIGNNVTSSGVTISSGDEYDVLSGGTMVSTTVSAGGLLVDNGGSIISTTIADAGMAPGGEVIVSGAAHASDITVQNGGTVDEYDGMVDTVTIAAGGLMNYDGGSATGINVLNGGTFTINPTSGNLTASNVQLRAGGTVAVGFNPAAASVTSATAGNVETFNFTSGVRHATVSVELQAGETLNLSETGADYEITVACFYPGTRLATAGGGIAVEDITPGTMLRTAAGALLPVRWLGRSEVSTRFADPLRVLPIRIKAGALAEGMPARDLLLSPDHALCLDDILVQAAALVNGTTILRETNVPECFTYFHVELDRHELLLAEGAPAESFVDHIDRMNFANWAEHPNAAPIEEMDLPRVRSFRQLPQQLRRRMQARAEAVRAA